MSYLEYNVKTVPAGLQKIAALNWPIVLLLTAIAGAGFVMLYSVADGQLSLWAEPQMKRFFLGLCAMIVVAIVPSWFWRNMSFLAYFAAMLLLLWVMFDGVVVNGARRWIELGPMRLQPSEVMKIALVMLLAAYYDWLPLEKTSHPYWVAIPVFVILLPVAFVTQQPDLGTSLLLIIAGATVMFMAGVHWAYFGFVALFGGGLIYAAFASKGTDWQILRDYQYDRIAIFLDPSLDPLGDGYHISQGLTAFGSGGWTGRGFMQGTQTQLGFLPEKQTDFIFNTLAEEFGFLGAVTLLALYALVLLFCMVSALQNKDRYGSLVTLGIGVTFFLFFAVNMGMVTGLLPVVGVPLPLVSYGGTSMLILLLGFGIMQSAHVHRPRRKEK